MLPEQLDLLSDGELSNPPDVEDAIQQLAHDGGLEARGAIYTRPEVVDFILDLAGYTPDQPLYERRVLEPSFGGGEFLFAIARRLVESWVQSQSASSAVNCLKDCIVGVELHEKSYEETAGRMASLLVEVGLSPSEASHLCASWLRQGDFLLLPCEEPFDYVVGNPPYVRQESIPASLVRAYRARYRTMFDRADLYIPFIERSLGLLAEDGCLTFICADRWMKNKYGGPLRAFIGERFHLQVYVDMVNTNAFLSEVSAYPAITVIRRSSPGPTRVARSPEVDPGILSTLAKTLRSCGNSNTQASVHEAQLTSSGTAPWLIGLAEESSIVRRLEAEYPTLEQAGCKVGIGVATGADKAFIGPYDSLDVEECRKLRLATTRDIATGTVQWHGLGVVNPFRDEGGLVSLDEYPKLRRYLAERREIIANRHCARKAPDRWYRTIDRINPSLASVPKLLIPDIKGEAHVAYEEGELYPHHNLYYVVSSDWDLRALQAVLLSKVARLFIAAYSTKMRGGFLRFQAQYLRRIRIMPWNEVDSGLRRQLKCAAEKWDVAACNEATYALYGLTGEEVAVLDGDFGSVG